jgi:hypothetical protein
MSSNIHQIFVANPITSNTGTDLMYFGQSPYAGTNDAAMTYTNFAAQFVLSSAIINGAHGGTGVNNGVSTITIGGNLTFSGAFTTTFTVTGTTSVTLPTSGTLATTSQTFTWNDVSGTSQAAVGNNGYIISNASQTTVTIPATIAEGQVIGIAGKGAAGWILQANTGQTINYGSSASSSAGSLTSTNLYDSVQVVCVTANTTFVVIASQGNLTVA